MTDISKCNNKSCPIRKTCYRYVAPADQWQSWARWEYLRVGGEIQCNGYWSVPKKGGDTRGRKEKGSSEEG